MSYLCDWCGEPIENASDCLDLLPLGPGASRFGTRHYHGTRTGANCCAFEFLDVLNEADGQADSAQKPLSRQELRQRAMEEWETMPAPRREAIALLALGDETMTQYQLAKAMNRTMLGFDSASRCETAIQSQTIRHLLQRMVEAGELDAKREVVGSSLRWFYTRRRRLEGPIVDLEQMIRDDRSA